MSVFANPKSFCALLIALGTLMSLAAHYIRIRNADSRTWMRVFQEEESPAFPSPVNLSKEQETKFYVCYVHLVQYMYPTVRAHLDHVISDT